MTIFHSCDFLRCALNYDTNFFISSNVSELFINYNSAKEIGSNWNLMRRWLIILKRIFSTSSFKQRKFSRVTIYSARKINDWSSWISEMKTFSPMARDGRKMEIADLLQRITSSLAGRNWYFWVPWFSSKVPPAERIPTFEFILRQFCRWLHSKLPLPVS